MIEITFEINVIYYFTFMQIEIADCTITMQYIIIKEEL